MLSDKDRELISIAASLAANCQPCAAFHLRAAQIAGASDQEIQQAVNGALSVNHSATEEMARLAARHLGTPISNSSAQENPLLRELVSISAAFAANSAPDLETHLARAQSLEATKGQILSAIKIAGAVKAMAERKMGTRLREESCAIPGGWLAGAGQSSDKDQARISDCGPQCECHSHREIKKGGESDVEHKL